jgi:hypothetical protein
MIITVTVNNPRGEIRLLKSIISISLITPNHYLLHETSAHHA